MALKITVFLIMMALLIAVLSFVGPQDSDKVFWRFIFRSRRIIDMICYAMFNVIAFIAIIKGTYDLIMTPLNDRSLIEVGKRLFGFLSIAVFSYIIFYSMKRFFEKE